MSWALSFTGHKSVVNETYHRVALHISLESLQSEEMIQKLTNLGQIYFLHVYVSVSTASLGEEGRHKGDDVNRLHVLARIEHAIRENAFQYCRVRFFE